MDLETLRKRVDALLALPDRDDLRTRELVYQGTIGIMNALYGSGSPQVKELGATLVRLGHPASSADMALHVLKGALLSIKGEIDSGFVGSLQARITADVLTD